MRRRILGMRRRITSILEEDTKYPPPNSKYPPPHTKDHRGSPLSSGLILLRLGRKKHVLY